MLSELSNPSHVLLLVRPLATYTSCGTLSVFDDHESMPRPRSVKIHMYNTT